MTSGSISAREYLRSIGREGVLNETAARPYKLAAVQDDIAALHEAGYSAPRIYKWLLEHRPDETDSIKGTKSEKADIDRIYVHIKRLDAGVVGAKRGRPAKNPAPKVAKVTRVPVISAPVHTETKEQVSNTNAAKESMFEKLKRQGLEDEGQIAKDAERNAPPVGDAAVPAAAFTQASSTGSDELDRHKDRVASTPVALPPPMPSRPAPRSARELIGPQA